MLPERSRDSRELVTTARFLADDGVTRRQTAGEIVSGRWQRAGLAIVMHNGPLSPVQRRRVARIHAGPHSVLTAFTVAEICGLHGWEREYVDVLAPAGTRLRSGCPVPVRLYLHGVDSAPHVVSGGGVELLPDALVRAAATFGSPRPACGLFAAAVQQRLTTTTSLAEALGRHSRTRHRRALTLAVADIEGGSQALSEIDFVRLCRRHRLPQPMQQRLRHEASGRRRYLDASWRRADGRLVVAEVDGGLHLTPRRWWDDQLRQNELALSGALVLRFPSVVVRTDPQAVAEQLRRALYGRR